MWWWWRKAAEIAGGLIYITVKAVVRNLGDVILLGEGAGVLVPTNQVAR